MNIVFVTKNDESSLRVNSIQAALAAAGMPSERRTYEKAGDGISGLAVFVDPPEGKKQVKIFKTLSGGIKNGMTLWHGKPEPPLSWLTCIDDHEAIREILWSVSLGNAAAHEVIDDLLSASGQMIAMIGANRQIEDVRPLKALFPDGTEVAHADLSPYLASAALTSGTRMIMIDGDDGVKAAYNAVTLPANLKLLSLGSGTGSVPVLLTRIDDYRDLELRKKRLEEIRVKMSEQRTIELASANELLENRAAELKKALDLLDYTNRQLMDDLNLASELQLSLLPKSFPQDIPVEFAQKYVPLNTIGGDFYDIIRIDATHFGLLIADVSGHGAGPALVTALVKTAFEHQCRTDHSPAVAMSKLNSEMRELLRTDHYLTAFYVVIDTDSLEMTYCNAGHPKQLLIHPDGTFEELGTMGFFIGMLDSVDFEEKTVALVPGDSLILFTDGVMETPDALSEPFGREGIVSAFLKHREKGVEAASNGIMQELILYMSVPEFQDDVTYLVMQVMDML